MNLKIKAAVQNFLSRIQRDPGVSVDVYENPTEEILEGMSSGKGVKLFGAAPGGGLLRKAPERAEENYLYSTRRFPLAADNVVPAAPNLPAGDAYFFSGARGGAGDGMGFPTGFVLGPAQTNLSSPNMVPQGQAFRLIQMGVSFNTEAGLDDMKQVLDAHAVVFQKQGQQWTLTQGPAFLWGGGSGISGVSTNQGQQAVTNGIPDSRAPRRLQIPRDIHNLENFNYIFSVTNGGHRYTDGTDWELEDFLTCTLWLWGLQLDRIPD